MSDIVSSFHNFTTAPVEQHFDLHLEQNTFSEFDVERQSLRYLFNVIAQEIDNKNLSKIERNKITSQMTIEKADFRYRLAKEYIGDFFADRSGYDYEALMIAVVCDEYTERINEPIDVNDPKKNQYHNDNYHSAAVFHKNDGLDDAIVGRACYIWDEARELRKNGLSPDPEDQPSLEAIFLAHINAFGILRNIEDKDYEACTDEELQAMLDNDMEPIFEYIRDDKEIGQILRGFLQQTGWDISEILNPSMAEEATAKPRLTLILPSPEA